MNQGKKSIPIMFVEVEGDGEDGPATEKMDRRRSRCASDGADALATEQVDRRRRRTSDEEPMVREERWRR